MSMYKFSPSPDLSTKETNYAYCVDGFSKEDIDRIVSLGDLLNITDGVLQEQKHDPAIRTSKVGWFQLNYDTSFIYDRLAYLSRSLNGQAFDFDLFGFNEDLQYTVYDTEGSHYEWHMDKGSIDQAPRKLSLTLQLSDPEDYEGGVLEFMIGGSKIIQAEKTRGMLYAFPSYIMHRVTPVTKGVRKSLVAWISGPKFK